MIRCMTNKSPELLTSEVTPEHLSVSEFPELARALTENRSALEALHMSAAALLERDGTDSTINGLPAVVTETYSVVPVNGKSYFARIGALKASKKNGSVDDQRLLVVFDEDEDTKVRTLNPYALYFKEFGSVASLVVANELDPILDNEKYAGLVQAIVDDIHRKVSLSDTEKTEARQRRRSMYNPFKLLSNYFDSTKRTSDGLLFRYDTLGDKRRSRLQKLAVVAIAYAHLPFGSPDAKIGPVPMPFPIEFAVDVNNSSDHRAQGFEKPEAAATVIIGAEAVSIPLLPDYDTSGVPDTTFISGFNEYTVYNESKQGLYEQDIPEDSVASHQDNPWPLFNSETRCYEVKAATMDGKTSIFTQSVAIAENVVARSSTQDILELCLKNGVSIAELDKGSVFIYQQ